MIILQYLFLSEVQGWIVHLLKKRPIWCKINHSIIIHLSVPMLMTLLFLSINLICLDPDYLLTSIFIWLLVACLFFKGLILLILEDLSQWEPLSHFPSRYAFLYVSGYCSYRCINLFISYLRPSFPLSVFVLFSWVMKSYNFPLYVFLSAVSSLINYNTSKRWDLITKHCS